ncbi:hypothetical protein [uncultured Chitinophaga sp.]|uniref:hypothetical protein n=1 Tax=uncultured Chitinophaga sp. TaxID=339340 RepID=UPI0025EE5CFB|nr:hypothetical protein [uncultured Chitinophaga sp.]
MDTRETIPTGGSFYDLLLDLYKQQKNTSVLYDDNGITRANGLITEMFEKEGKQWVRLSDGAEIRIDTLQAVNGIFSAGYSEC